MHSNDFSEFKTQIFGKKTADKKENLLFFETNSILSQRISFAKEFATNGEINNQSTLILTDSFDKNWAWFPKIIKKVGGESTVDHSKSTKPLNCTTVVKITHDKNNIAEIFQELKDFYDNSLESENDDRMFRVIFDLAGILSHKLLMSMMCFSRKTNVCFFVICENQIGEKISDYFCYFDKIFELSEVRFNMKETSGTLKVKKWREFDSFANAYIRNVGSEKVLFWGFEKGGIIGFRELDITEII